MIKEQKMIDWAIEQFHKAKLCHRNDFINCEFRDLAQYHSTLGRSIRNEFKLWKGSWEPELEGNVDYSTNHPDQVSQRVIEKVWKELQKNDG